MMDFHVQVNQLLLQFFNFIAFGADTTSTLMIRNMSEFAFLGPLVGQVVCNTNIIMRLANSLGLCMAVTFLGTAVSTEQCKTWMTTPSYRVRKLF